MKPKMKICFKCEAFTHWQNYYDCSNAEQKAKFQGHYANMGWLVHYKEGDLLYKPKIQLNEEFDVPSKCPYTLEHVIL